ncbi:MAG: FkbM family methyltransferase [Candidatus Micrarchaeota archaeon]|nr:FkbM family methyltransferase [Candidatus Micrarchaeota archaeon]MDE1847990.1 FkbM family methyltransferase [Candidatus Micrarchaeota archaeon]MDE1864694.1 FkbM family methyltransferase [Candidatus Micrarchaeota archaeon]
MIDAYELFPYTYKIGTMNLVTNDMTSRVSLRNMGVAGNRKIIKIPASHKSYAGYGDNTLNDFGRGKLVKIITLQDVLDLDKIKDAVLKCDSQGSEYDMIANSSVKTLSKFSQIIIEYHYGWTEIERKLIKAGFRVQIKKYKDVWQNDRLESERTGMLYATKKQ